jgi:hypothetical protein
MTDWIPLPDGVAWKSPPLLLFDLSRRDLVARFGPSQMRDLDSNGVGLFDAWFLRFPCGLEVALWQFQQRSHEDALVVVEGDDSPRYVEVHANQRERSHILFHLALDPAAADSWLPDHSYLGDSVWRVMRQDDNGNLATMSAFTSRCEADATVLEFEGRGHKQTYWVEGPTSD